MTLPVRTCPPACPPAAPRGIARLVVSSRDNKARTYQLQLEALERGALRARDAALRVAPDHVMHAHSMPILCMDCCAVPEHVALSTARTPSRGAAAATVNVLALGSAGAAQCWLLGTWSCHILCTSNCHLWSSQSPGISMLCATCTSTAETERHRYVLCVLVAKPSVAAGGCHNLCASVAIHIEQPVGSEKKIPLWLQIPVFLCGTPTRGLSYTDWRGTALA